MNRKECLEESIKCVCTDRERQYGSPENNFSLIAELWSVYKGENFTAEDVAMMMALLKIARIKAGKRKADNYVDLAGYAACACELRFPDAGKTCDDLTEKELKEKMKAREWMSDSCGVNKETNKPMMCDDIVGCRECLFDKDLDCYDSMRKWLENHFTDEGKIVDSKNNKKINIVNLNKIAIHCDTKEKAEKLIKIIKIPKRFVEYWNDYKQDTCYSFEIKLSDALFAKKDEYEKIGYTILEFDDFDWSEYEEGK